MQAGMVIAKKPTSWTVIAKQTGHHHQALGQKNQMVWALATARGRRMPCDPKKALKGRRRRSRRWSRNE